MSEDSVEINANNFLSLDFVKTYFKFTDKQDDDTLLQIVNAANNELKKALKTVVDDITQIEGTKFFGEARDVALVFCNARIKKDINQMYDESNKILEEDYKPQLETLLGDVRAIAPERTSREVVTREVPFEDDYFAERHVP